MREKVQAGSVASVVVAEELALLERVRRVALAVEPNTGGLTADHFESELVALRDQIADEKQEDIASIVEQMTRVASLASRRGRKSAQIDLGNPYFAHLQISTADGTQDILIGRRSFIDRPAGVQIVDWREAPISKIYYRYEEGDEFEEEVAGRALRGTVLCRRHVSIAGGKLRRVGTPEWTLVCNTEGEWFDAGADEAALLEGGQGTAARPPAPAPRTKQKFQVARAPHAGKELPEIAALIDREQFSLITERSHGLIVIQGGAGSGKTTVALHRIAYLLFNQRQTFHPSRCMFVVPSLALERYVAGVLPALGVQGVRVVTYGSWARHLRQRLVPIKRRYSEETPAAVSRLKKHPAFLQLLEQAAEQEINLARERLQQTVGSMVQGDTLLAAWDAAKDDPPLKKVTALRLALKRSAVDLPLPTLHRGEQCARELNARLSALPRILSELCTDRGRLAALAEPNVFESARAGEIETLVSWSSEQLEDSQELDGIDADRLEAVDGAPLEANDSAKGCMDVEDDALYFRLYQIMHGQLERTDGAPLVFDHIAIDEAQDLAPVDIKLLYCALSAERSLTIAGDTAQQMIFDNAFRGWAALLKDVGVPDSLAQVRPLKIAYRSTAQVMQFANRLIGEREEGIVARHGAPVALHEFSETGEAVAFVSEALRSLQAREPSASVAVIARYAAQAEGWWHALERSEVAALRWVRNQEFSFKPGVDVTDVTQVKGLEFDYVIVVDVVRSNYPDSVEASHFLHIAATRTTHQLWLITTGEPSPLLQRAMKTTVV